MIFDFFRWSLSLPLAKAKSTIKVSLCLVLFQWKNKQYVDIWHVITIHVRAIFSFEENSDSDFLLTPVTSY